MYYTYVLRSLKDSKLYTGATLNLRERFKLHNNNKVIATKSRGPFELIYYEACQNQKDAFMREKYLKSGMGKRYLKNRLKRSLSLTGQAGVSLLMAILVLASITAISFSLATIVFIEIRASSDFVRSERALYAAYAITEEALFKYSRVIDFPYLDGAGQLNSVTLAATEELESQSPFVDVVSSTKQYDLVDAEDPNGPGGYKRIRLVYFSQGITEVLQYTLWSIDPAGTDGQQLVSQDELNGYGDTFEDVNLDTSLQYQLDLVNSSGTDITINLYTYGPTVDEPKGLPNIGQTYVNIVASYLGLTRKYQAKIPVQY